MSGVLAIVGRPNVGKSALFNRIAGRRIAIVHDQPGVTRDRVTAEVEWGGARFTLVDTGGLGLRRGEKAPDVITDAALDQVELAIEAANAILLVVNVQEDHVPLDTEVAERLRTAGKPVLVVVNKSDTENAAQGSVDFSSLGFDAMFPVSAIHGRGMDALMEAAMALLPAEEPSKPAPDTGETEPGKASEPGTTARPVKLAIVGRPNVGKSSLINALTQSNRVVVSPVPGTTRDAVDVPFEVTTEDLREHYVLVDTAGVRKRRRVDSSVEFFSVKRTEEAIERSDITVLVLDATAGILEQDKKIAALITEAQRACIVVVNKWDLVSDSVREAREVEITRRDTGSRKRGDVVTRMTTLGEFGRWVQEKLFFLDYAPVIFTSAQSGFHLDRFLEAVRYVAAQLRQRVPTAVLNRTLHDAVSRRQPVTKRGEILRFYYATQIGEAPPRFLLFLNRTDLFNRPYEKFLGDALRTAFGYEGCPLVLLPRARPKTIEPMRRHRATDGKSRDRAKAPPEAPVPGLAKGPAPRSVKPASPRPSRGAPAARERPKGSSRKPSKAFPKSPVRGRPRSRKPPGRGRR